MFRSSGLNVELGLVLRLGLGIGLGLGFEVAIRITKIQHSQCHNHSRLIDA